MAVAMIVPQRLSGASGARTLVRVHPFRSQSECHDGKYIPRWEWRTFGEALASRTTDSLRSSRIASKKATNSTFFPVTDENVKVRDLLMDIKKLSSQLRRSGTVEAGDEGSFPLPLPH